MGMKPPILTAATLVATCAGLLPAADSQLLNLVMPDAKVLAGVNVDQAKGTPFGQYILNQVQSQGPHLQQLTALTGFDPTRDVHEILVASNTAPGSQGGLLLARGNFNVSQIQAAVQQQHGGITETYNGVTLLEDPQKANALAFLDPTLAIAGDVASVKGAIDRQTVAAPLSAALLVQVNQWSGQQDAWVLTAVPPSALQPKVNAPNAANPALENAFQNVQQLAGGVKFGAQVVLTGQAQTDTAQNATGLAGVLQFLINLAQIQAQQNNPPLAAALPSVSVTASGSQVNVSLSVPEPQAEQMVQPHAGPAPGMAPAPATTRRPATRRL